MRYICEICGRKFDRRWNKERHLRSIHRLDKKNCSTTEFRNNPNIFCGYSKDISSNSRKFEFPSFKSDYNQFSSHDLERANDLFQNKSDIVFNPYQNQFENHLYQPEDESDIYQENTLLRLCFKLKPRIDIVRNALYRRNPYSAYTLPFRIYIFEVNKFIVFLTYSCISEKSTQTIDRWLRKLGY